LTLESPQTVSGTIVPAEGHKIPSGLIVALAPRENRSDGGGGGMSRRQQRSIQDVVPGDYDVVLASSGLEDDSYVRAIGPVMTMPWLAAFTSDCSPGAHQNNPQS
jgi:hypothetical protein